MRKQLQHSLTFVSPLTGGLAAGTTWAGGTSLAHWAATHDLDLMGLQGACIIGTCVATWLWAQRVFAELAGASRSL